MYELSDQHFDYIAGAVPFVALPLIVISLPPLEDVIAAESDSQSRNS
jgi:hypothetical protein